MNHAVEADIIRISTDGSCIGNPGPGAWAFVAVDEKTGEMLEVQSERFSNTTNQQMELSAVIAALRAFQDADRPLVIESDSQYVIKGITEWIQSWKRNNWRTAARKPVSNAHLWRELEGLVERRDISWQWVKGHAGNQSNERADALAYSKARSLEASHG